MKKTKGIFLKVLIITVLLQFLILSGSVEAGFWSDIFQYGDEFLEKGEVMDRADKTSGVNDDNVKEIVNDIYNILFPLGVVVTVIVGVVLGIKFMLASAEDKAKIKESMIPYVMGCVVIYGAFGIWKVCIQIFSTLS